MILVLLLIHANFPHQGSHSLNLLDVDRWRSVPSLRHLNGNFTFKDLVGKQTE